MVLIWSAADNEVKVCFLRVGGWMGEGAYGVDVCAVCCGGGWCSFFLLFLFFSFFFVALVCAEGVRSCVFVICPSK